MGFYKVRWQDSLYYLSNEWNRKSKEVLSRKWFIRSKRKVWGVRETLSLSHQVWNGPPCSLNSFSERSLVRLDPEPSLDHNGLYLRNMFISNSWCVYSLKRERITRI